jgi:hypothetical protein
VRLSKIGATGSQTKEKNSGPDINPAAFVLLWGGIAPLFKGGNRLAACWALHRLGSRLLVQFKRALGI